MLKLINKQRIQSTQYFPIYAFSKICPDIRDVERLKKQQNDKINSIVRSAPHDCNNNYHSVEDILTDSHISQSNKTVTIVCSIMNGSMDLESVKAYLQTSEDKRTTEYRKILCAYDLKHET